MSKVAVITGASRGIGRAIALKLAEEGFTIIINYRSNQEASDAVLKEIENNGGKAKAFQCDVSQFDQVADFIKVVKDEFGSIDLLVNNAGITKDTLLMRMDEKAFDDVIAVNLKGTFNCTKHVSRIMLKQRTGKIVNITSVVGLIGNIGQTNYTASKAGVIGFTKACAKEFALRGITVNAIAPGFIETEMTEDLADKVKENFLSNIPLNRMGKSEEVAHLVAFLASEKANYITGQVINVDGGMVM